MHVKETEFVKDVYNSVTFAAMQEKHENGVLSR